MQPVNRTVREILRADLWTPQAQRLQTNAQQWARNMRREPRKFFSGFMAFVLIISALLLGAYPAPTSAASTNVIVNGGFESGFSSQPGYGAVGNGWYAFTNGGAVQTSFWDDTWAPTLADGAHSQGIGFSTVGIDVNEQDRYAGIYQTVLVSALSQYTLNLQGLIRSTRLDGDPYRYVVQVGWTSGPQPNWQAVSNWQDTNWYNYYDRENPGALSSFSTNLTPDQGYATVYVRVWKKWWAPDEQVNVNVDAITLTGPAVQYGSTGVVYGAPNTGGAVAGYDPYLQNVPAAQQGANSSQSSTSGFSCTASEMVYNGGFEMGFNPVAAGSVGKGWGYFTNGGAANYGFQNDQWPRVVAEGHSSQLVSIDTLNQWPADGDRFAGIYQQIGYLTANTNYEFSIDGILRGSGGDTSDPWRFVAEWGYTTNGSTDWTQVNNWETLTFGEIYPRTEPGTISNFTRQFTAPSTGIVLFVRAWSKWPVPDQQYDMNVDAISIKGCGTGGGGGGTPPPSNCVYVVRPGDTLSAIAKNTGTTVQQLMQLNGITNPNIIYVGQQIYLPNCGNPQPVPPPQPPPATRTYVVQPGDTLSAIAQRCGTTVAVLQQLNGITNPNLIFVGQILKLP